MLEACFDKKRANCCSETYEGVRIDFQLNRSYNQKPGLFTVRRNNEADEFPIKRLRF